MAWLQNLAGKAEDLLNKIDQNAATVLHDSTKLLDISQSNIIEPIESDDSQLLTGIKKNIFNKVSDIDDSEILTGDLNYQRSVTIDTIDSKHDLGKVTPTSIFEKEIKIDSCGVSSKSDSISNKYDELQLKFEEKLLKLENENQEVNQQILNIQHLYSEIKNENINLRAQLQRADESVVQAQNEMELYKARAQRILQEKENLISFKKEDVVASNEKLSVLSNYNEELNKELSFQDERNKELTEKNSSLITQINDMQQELVSLHNAQCKEKQDVQNILAMERKNKLLAEEECKNKLKEINVIKSDINQLQRLYNDKNRELEVLKRQIKEINNYQLASDMDTRIQSLTDTLMMKQSGLETITSERNALKIQFEKLERDYNKLLQCERNSAFSRIHDIEEGRTQIPKLTTVSPLDVGVKRKVKHTFSTLDAISIRTGVFLRRYPIARIFVLCYMILLHVWVLIILFTYVPIR